jgi:hypothetical protein
MPRNITKGQAAVAIYIDFEGTMNDPPSLLGILIRGSRGDSFRQVALDYSFQGLPALPEANDGALAHSTVEETIEALLGLAEESNLMFVAWSTRELQVVKESDLSADLKRRFENRHINAITIAKRWRSRFYPKVTFESSGRIRRNALHNYMQLIDYDIPRAYGPGNAASRIKDVKGQMERRETFDQMTPVAKGKWTKLLRHNQHDCSGMRAVIERCADDLNQRP